MILVNELGIKYLFLNCDKINIPKNLPSWPFLRVQFTGVKYFHIVVLPISKTFSILPKWNYITIKLLPIPSSPSLWQLLLDFLYVNFDHSEYLIWIPHMNGIINTLFFVNEIISISILLRCIHVEHVPEFSYFLRLNDTTLYVYTKFYLSIHPLKEVCIASISCQLWMLLWI